MAALVTHRSGTSANARGLAVRREPAWGSSRRQAGEAASALKGPEQKNDPRDEVISSAVASLPRIPARIAPAGVGLSPDSVLLIGTDGFGDPLGDGDGKLGRLFAENLRTPPHGRGLAHLLDFSRETFDDDRTLVALWPRTSEREVHR
jgi:hypothetical protein